MTALSNLAINDISAERERQISVEGWSPEHDDSHSGGALAKAAACYAVGRNHLLYQHVDGRARGEEWGREWRYVWPWDKEWWKPSLNRRRDLVKAGALIVAEIERLDRAALARGETLPQSQGEKA